MVFNSSITYGGLTLTSVSITNLGDTSHKIKQTLGKRLYVGDSIGTQDEQDLTFTVSGRFFGANRYTYKSSLRALNDGKQHAYSDGEHDGDYVITPESLKFTHSPNRPVEIPYTFTLLEW